MKKPLVMIVEDDPRLGEIYALTLQTKFDTEIITEGDKAVARLYQVVPALVVLDLNLPNISGKEILAQIRSDSRLAKTRVILASADSNQAALLTDEADIVILKPVSPTQLRELALRLLTAP